MTTISYAQNYEDVILLRALRGVERGFYVDVGAQDPIHGSVTKAFYEKGWRGINVEPVKRWFDAVTNDRPEDVNLQVVVSETVGDLEFFEVPETGLSSLDKAVADRHVEQGHIVQAYSIGSRSLDDILDEYAPGDIHFLKIDVEGAEEGVLKSISLDKYRPWILVIEATEPNSQIPNYEQWESRVLANGYDMVYEDGLNRFYLAHERADLVPAFRLPPNYFDFFVPYSEWWARAELEVRARKLEAKAQVIAEREQELRTRIDERDAKAREVDALTAQLRATSDSLLRLQQEHEELGRRVQYWADALAKSDAEVERLKRVQLELAAAKTQLAHMEQSHSWRITAPLRAARRLLGRVRRRLRRQARTALIPTAQLLVKVPGMRAIARKALANHGHLKHRLSALAYAPASPFVLSSPASVEAAIATEDQGRMLSESENQAYVFLKSRRK